MVGRPADDSGTAEGRAAGHGAKSDAGNGEGVDSNDPVTQVNDGQLLTISHFDYGTLGCTVHLPVEDDMLEVQQGPLPASCKPHDPIQSPVGDGTLTALGMQSSNPQAPQSGG